MENGFIRIRRALMSVKYKDGLAEFAAGLQQFGVEIISSGGTADVLEQNGIRLRRVQEWTGFPSMLGHRVATLHPKVHGGILARRDNVEDQQDIAKYGLELVDLVVVGLYPFQEVVAKGCSFEEAIENIDVGGPTLIRAAAKNHKWVTVLTSQRQYHNLLCELKARNGCVSQATRSGLALSAFVVTGEYDRAIRAYLATHEGYQAVA